MKDLPPYTRKKSLNERYNHMTANRDRFQVIILKADFRLG